MSTRPFCHLLVSAALWALPFVTPLSIGPAHSTQREESGMGSAATPAGATEITEQDVLFAYHRMSGSEPDFRILAETAVANRPPSTHRVRDPVAERRYLTVLAARRLRSSFESFDLDQTFTLSIDTEIFTYREENGGIPIESGGLRRLALRNPINPDQRFSLRFSNADAVAIVPATDANSAAQLLQNVGLASLGRWAGHGRITVTFALTGVLPQVRESDGPPVTAEILSAVVESVTGQPLHVFSRLGSRAAAALARSSGPPTLPTASLSGLRIGMPVSEAQDLALQSHPVPFAGAFFDQLPSAAVRGVGQPDCSAGVVADLLAFSLPLAPEDLYGSCLAVAEGDLEDAPSGRVREVTEVRFLPNLNHNDVRNMLEERFGSPLEDLGNGRLVWVGQEPGEAKAEGLLELRANFIPVMEGGLARKPGVLLALTLRRHVPPSEDGS